MKKRKRKQLPWWQDVKVWRRAGITVAAVLLLAIGGWFVVTFGGSDEAAVYLTEPASDFTLPTIDGSEVTLMDHRGEHNMLLYFNEGMG